MSQLSAAAPLRSTKQLLKQKEIRQVKSAIRWHERKRTQRQIAGSFKREVKSTVIERQQWHHEHVVRARRTALKVAREDWKLGPLRPNRAVGDDKYGALDNEGLRRPQIPVKVWKHFNEVREKKGLEPSYPLVVDDKKYFHIVKDDRVVVLRGREAGKIGVVQDLNKSSHEVFIKGINMVAFSYFVSHLQQWLTER
jgi:large subunit ribosomal protein L24